MLYRNFQIFEFFFKKVSGIDDHPVVEKGYYDKKAEIVRNFKSLFLSQFLCNQI